MASEEVDDMPPPPLPKTEAMKSGRSDRTCSICLVDVQDAAPIPSLDCGHVFHVDCLARWFGARRANEGAAASTCPNCRQPCHT